MCISQKAFDEAVTSDSVYAASNWDTYSLGIMLWQLWYREEPWGGKSTHKIYSSLMKGKRPIFMEPFPPLVLRELIEQMWHQEHQKRPTMRDALRNFESNILPLFVDPEPSTPVLQPSPEMSIFSQPVNLSAPIVLFQEELEDDSEL